MTWACHTSTFMPEKMIVHYSEKKNENFDKCPVCEAPRYKDTHACGKKISYKVLHYFQLTSRLR